MTGRNSCDYIVIEKKAGSLECISDFIQERSLSVKLGFRKTWELMLVIDEVCSNILSHSTSTDSTFKITWRYDGNRITVEILDRGFPYNPLNPADEDDEGESLGAMNTYMIDRMVDSAEYQRTNETNRICIMKYRRKNSNGKKAGTRRGRNGNNG